MTAKSILTEEILIKMKKLAEEGYSSGEIANNLGIKRTTCDLWIKKNNIEVQKRGNKESYDKFIKFTNILKNAIYNNEKIKLNEVLVNIGMHPTIAQRILNEFPEYKKATRTKSEAALADKTLSFAEAESRLPEGEKSKVIGFKDGKYQIQTQDGFIYEKSSAKICQGDPRGKSGTVKSLEDVEKYLKELGYTYQSGYINIKKSFNAIHDKCGNIRANRLINFKDQQCPSCSNNGTSIAELSVKKWIESLGFKTIKYKFKGKTRGQEIDIYIPQLNIGIEYCGLYWHHEDSPHPRKKDYHFTKMKMAESNNIRLITIYENEWKDRNSQVKNFLKSVFGIIDRKIYARKCVLREITSLTSKTFLEENHIQGNTSKKISFGLYYNGELVAVGTGGKHHRNNKENSFVFSRLAFKEGVQVIGGASKINKALIRFAKDNEYDSIISWSDSRYSLGNVYKSIGYILHKENKADYDYLDKNCNIFFNKQSLKKEKLIKQGAIGSTEKEMAKNLGYHRIWNCGKKTWKISLS